MNDIKSIRLHYRKKALEKKRVLDPSKGSKENMSRNQVQLSYLKNRASIVSYLESLSFSDGLISRITAELNNGMYPWELGETGLERNQWMRLCRILENYKSLDVKTKTYIGSGQKVKIVKGEYAGKTGVVQSKIQKRYSKEQDMCRVLIDGFPKPGGWNGIAIVDERFLEKI